jgi:hypothetical protein
MTSALPAYEPGTHRVEPVRCTGAGRVVTDAAALRIPGLSGRWATCPHCQEVRHVGTGNAIIRHLEMLRLIVHPHNPDHDVWNGQGDMPPTTLPPLHPTELPVLPFAVFTSLAWDDEGRPRVTWHGGRQHTATTHALHPKLRRRIGQHLEFTVNRTSLADIVELVLASQAWQLPALDPTTWEVPA